jgi:NAD(P)-dependent dehydrogenase (short-subunit alcohol dehydrogenase family)
VRDEQGRLDVLVNDISEGEAYDWVPFWRVSLEKGFRALRQGIHSHLITSRHAVPLMIEGERSSPGLIVEVTDGDSLDYHGTLFYDLVKTAVNRIAYVMAEELSERRVAAVAVTPGYMRTEAMLDHFAVTEANWRDGVKRDPNFAASETPFFVGRAVAALAADPRVMEKSGGLFGSWTLSDEYGFGDVDGRRPHLGRHFQEVFGDQPPAGPRKTPFRWAVATAPATARRRPGPNS